MEVLKKGAVGPDVKRLQRQLGIIADGLFGQKTEDALKAWQVINNLEPDGVFGCRSYAAMFPPETHNKEAVYGCVYNPIHVNVGRRPRKIEYLVIHYTAGWNSLPGAALKERQGFLGRKASADFVVDDANIIQLNPSLNDYYTWAVGDGGNGIFNKNSISIEICSTCSKNANVCVPNHAGWSFSKAALDNAVSLCRTLVKKYRFKPAQLVRHYDATGKYCPGIKGWNDGKFYDELGLKVIAKNNSSEWEAFKRRVFDE